MKFVKGGGAMKKTVCGLGLVVILFVIFCVPLHAFEIGRDVKVTFLGHAAFKIVSPKGVVIYIDPFLTHNPKTPQGMKKVDKADLILVTHGHGDHVGDTLSIAQKTNAKVVAIAELARYLKNKGAGNVVGMNKGGSYTTHGIRLTMVNALHSSSVTETEKTADIQKKQRIVYVGDPSGFIIRFENGFVVYHAGDTAVFGDMKIIAEIYKPELSLLPIGSHYTMDPVEATYAARLLKSKYVIPMHYGTFPVLTGTPEEYLRLMKEVPQTRVIVLKPGDTVQ
jgi:L-ascorbate metabolism protein UlaG (beta-lactamase superfamily)